MKKLLICALCITLILVSFVACDKNEDEIELTIDNIKDYVEIDASVKVGGTTRCKYEDEWVNLYNYFECAAQATGNSHYEYKDVVIGIRFYHHQPITDELISEETVYLKLNLSGSGDVSCQLGTAVEKDGWDNISDITYTFYSNTGIKSALDYTAYEIVSVTGTVVKY